MDTSNDSTTPLKRCIKCGVEKPATTEYFYMRSDGRWLRSSCITCTRKANDQYRLTHIEQWREYGQRSYRKRIAIDPDYCRLKMKRVDPVKRRVSSLRYETENKERRKQMHLEWARSNRDLRQASKLRRKATRLSLPADFTVDDQRLALNYFHGCCAVCGRQLKDLFGSHALNWDHWIPLALGGGTTVDNMLPLCGGEGGCNNRKKDKHPSEWLVLQFGAKKAESIGERIQQYFRTVARHD